MKGCNLLCASDPLFFSILEAFLPKLSPIHWDQSVKTEDDVDVLLAKTFVRQDMFSKRHLHCFSRCSYSNLCRTVTKQDCSARDSTTPVISLRLLVLLDYLLHKLPYWSTSFYE